MQNDEIYQCGKEIEVNVFSNGPGHEMRLRVNGASVFGATPFAIENYGELDDLYESLDGYSSIPSDVATYHGIEHDLGRRLGRLLFGPGGVHGGTPLNALLDRALHGLGENEYVRLLLTFEHPDWSKLPWELALWTHPETHEELCLGRHGRMTLSRLDPGRAGVAARRANGKDGWLSILNIGAHTTSTGMNEYELTREFLQNMSEQIQGLHAASRKFPDLWQYWQESLLLSGRYPEIDVVHWTGHGDPGSVMVPSPSVGTTKLDADALFARTKGAFLYVLLACDTAGTSAADGIRVFSSRLLAAGAPAVLAVHDTARQDEFSELPLLYPMLFQGVALDYCAQYVRRLFARKNSENTDTQRTGWHKLVLRLASTWYLDCPVQVAQAHAGVSTPALDKMILQFAALRVRRALNASATSENNGAFTKMSTAGMNRASMVRATSVDLASSMMISPESAAARAAILDPNAANPPTEVDPPPQQADEAAMLRRHYEVMLHD